MSYYADYHRSVYRRLQRLACMRGDRSANALLRDAGAHTWKNGYDEDYCIRVDARVVAVILPRLERFWGLRKEDA